MQKTQSGQPSSEDIKELNERFGRLIKQLGFNNQKGSVRYNFEVDFAYAYNELVQAPPSWQGKLFEAALGVVNSLISHLRTQNKEDV